MRASSLKIDVVNYFLKKGKINFTNNYIFCLKKNAVTVSWISVSAFAWSKTFTVSLRPSADAV